MVVLNPIKWDLNPTPTTTCTLMNCKLKKNRTFVLSSWLVITKLDLQTCSYWCLISKILYIDIGHVDLIDCCNIQWQIIHAYSGREQVIKQ